MPMICLVWPWAPGPPSPRPSSGPAGRPQAATSTPPGGSGSPAATSAGPLARLHPWRPAGAAQSPPRATRPARSQHDPGESYSGDAGRLLLHGLSTISDGPGRLHASFQIPVHAAYTGCDYFI